MPKVSKPVQAQQQPAPPAGPVGNTAITSDVDDRTSYTFLIFNAVPSWLASFLVNISVILILALLAITTEQNTTISLEAGEIDAAGVDDIDFSLEDLELDNADPLESSLSEAPSQEFQPESELLTI